MDDLAHLLQRAAGLAADYRASLPSRRVAPASTAVEVAAGFDGALPAAGAEPASVLEELVRAAGPGLMATAGPRFFGFVIGGALEAATAAEIMAAGWDQCAFNDTLSPAAAAAEHAAGTWLKELLGIPAGASVGFVTGGQQANTVGLAAGRNRVLAEVGWDVERRGLAGAPPVRIVAGVERHATIDRSLRLLGFGTASLEEVPADANGAIDVEALAVTLADGGPGPTLVCLQAGNVNTGACDDLSRAIPVAHEHGAWVHVDGAFGLWAAASPATAHLTEGLDRADSWACDGHKWLNVPYDSGFVFCAHPEVHATAVRYTAAYLTGQGDRLPLAGADYTLESSRRARGFATWAALRQLGAEGVATLVDQSCRLARRFAAGLQAGGAEVVNDVVLNQVLVDIGGVDVDGLVEAVQRDGTCWLGATTWRGRRLLRVSVSNWSTTAEDVDRSVAAILRLADELRDGAR